jgi:Flp pilus assembly pilin Flp
MNKVRNFFSRLRSEEHGVALVEWVVMAALIGGVAVGVMTLFDTKMDVALGNLGKCIATPTAAACNAATVGN